MKWPLSELRRSRSAKWTIGIGIAVVIYTLTGFLLLPVIIKWQMLKRLPPITRRSVAVQQVMVNPFTLSLTIRGFTLKEPSGDVFCSFDELYVKLRLVSMFRRAFVFKEINLKKPLGSVVFQPDGKFNFSNLVSGSPSETKPKTKVRELPHFVVEQLNIDEGTLFFADVNRKLLVKLSQIGLALDGLSDQTNAPVSTALSFCCDGTGTVALQGTMLPFARSGDVQVQATDLDLRLLQPYVREIWKLEITGGALSATGRVQYAAAGVAAPLARFTGELGVANFTSVDTEAHDDFLKVDSLTLNGLDLRYQPHALDLASVNVVGLRGNVFIHPDKTCNWKDMVQNAEQLHDLVVKLQLNKLFPFQIGTVSFDNTSLAFVDQSIEPHVVSEIQDVDGSVTGLSSTENATTTVDLHGKVDGHSTFAVSGTINPLADDLKIDLTLSLKNGEMAPGSPYAAKYVGYPIRQGQLSLEAHYVVNQRALTAENKFSAHQLRLGGKSNSPDATQLRVKLAIALLQDRNGIVTFDMPVSGQLDDPNFKFGPVITEIFMTIITKAVSNPFALLGSLFGGGGEQLSFVEFKPGRSDFAAGETKKLDTLAKALYAHPALELEITGSVDTTTDRVALATSKLHQQLKARRVEELTAAGKPAVSLDAVRIAPQDYDRLIRIAYVAAASTEPVVTAPPVATRAKQNFGPRRPLSWFSLHVARTSADHSFTDMELRIIETIDVTPDDYRTLMQARADRVHNYLLQTGRVAAEQMFIVAPKPVDPSFQGESRVDLSLE